MNLQVKKNFSYAFLAQGISLFVSCTTNLILPKVMGTQDYSYWQLFIFYATYIPCLALGINDGVYLRLGGMERKRIDNLAVKSQFFFGLVYQTVIACILGVVVCATCNDGNRKNIFLCVLIYFLIYTCHNFLGYFFQAVNETNIYSKSIVVNKILYLIIQISLIILGKAKVLSVVCFYILAMAVALVYLLVCIRDNFGGIHIDFIVGKKEAIISMKTGISLMISNVCSMLVLGIGRQLIDAHWGILAFGKVSFSFTLINFALTFITQISMVLFPVLRQTQGEKLKKHYISLKEALFKILPFMYILYFPASFILGWWLPEYKESIYYLTIIFPICFFECKMNLIGNTFFKVLKKQTVLLKINLLTICISGILGILSIVIFDSLEMVIISMVIAVIFRSVLAEMILNKYMEEIAWKTIVYDLILSVLFCYSSRLLNVKLAIGLIAGGILVRFIKCEKK